jgi:hypothetical protein
MFQRYVVNVSYGCCKSRSECCTYCNGCTRMLQARILNVSSVFFYVCCKCVYLDVTYAFTYMMQVFYLNVAYVYIVFKCFSGVFANVSDACFKSFICFQTYVTIVASGCFKTKSSVASPSSPFLLSYLGVSRGKAEAVPTSAGGRIKRDVGGQARYVGWGVAARASGRLVASHAHLRKLCTGHEIISCGFTCRRTSQNCTQATKSSPILAHKQKWSHVLYRTAHDTLYCVSTDKSKSPILYLCIRSFIELCFLFFLSNVEHLINLWPTPSPP